MVTQDTIFETFLAGLELKTASQPVQRVPYLEESFLNLHDSHYCGLHVVVGKEEYSRYCGQVARSNKPYPHVENEFRESICSCTGTLPNHAVKSCQCTGACGSSKTRRTPRFLRPVRTKTVSRCKTISSSNGTKTGIRIKNYRAERFLRNRNQIEFIIRDHRGRDRRETVLLAWLKPVLANASTSASTSASVRGLKVFALASITRNRVKAEASAGEVTAIIIWEILLGFVKGFQTKKFT